MKRYFILGLLLSGCSSVPTKKDVVYDLKEIIEQNADCPALCAAVKAYISSKIQ